MIINIPGEMGLGSVAAAQGPRTPESTPALFRMVGSGPERAGWQRWSGAVTFAALFHIALLVVGPRAFGHSPDAGKRVEPELVFYSFPPPPPPPAGRSHVAVATHRPKRPHRKPQTVVIPRNPEPVPVPETPPVEPEVEEPVAEAPPPDANPENAEGVAGGVEGGVAGGTVGGVAGGLVGSTGSPLGIGQVAQPPQVLKQVKPQYPRRAKVDGLQGLVLVRIIIGVDGNVETSHTEIVQSVPALDEAAIAAINQWRFTPAIGHQGAPVRVVVEVPIQFSLM